MEIFGDTSGEIDACLNHYRELEAEKKKRQADIEANRELQNLKKLREELDAQIKASTEAYGVDGLSLMQEDLKEQIMQNWPDKTKKTYQSPVGMTVTLRTTKSLKIDSVKGIVDFLVKNDKVVEAIKSFNLAVLRKFADVGLLNNMIHYEEKLNVVIEEAFK